MSEVTGPKGLKYDQGKLRWDLLPFAPVRNIVAVLTFGALKYKADSWQEVEEARSRYFAAAMRHIDAWRCGESVDAESGLPHLAHALCDLVFLLSAELGFDRSLAGKS